MYDNLFDGYDDNDYVYVIDGCFGYYVSEYPLDPEFAYCEQCGNTDWEVTQGYVKDLKEFFDDFEEYEYDPENEDELIINEIPKKIVSKGMAKKLKK